MSDQSVHESNDPGSPEEADLLEEAFDCSACGRAGCYYFDDSEAPVESHDLCDECSAFALMQLQLDDLASLLGAGQAGDDVVDLAFGRALWIMVQVAPGAAETSTVIIPVEARESSTVVEAE